jgi:hypothetical protein
LREVLTAECLAWRFAADPCFARPTASPVGLSKEGLATPISGPGPGPIIVIVIVVIVVVIIAVAAAVAPALGFRTSGARLHQQDNAADHRE